MKKTILFFSLLLVGTFIMFSFQKSDNLVKTDNNSINIEKQATHQDNTFSMNANFWNDKCGGGSHKSKKAASKSDSKCGEGKCGSGKCGDGKASGKKHKFMDSDSNGDGKVSMAEFKAHATKEFPNKDKNGDGKVTSDECKMFDKFNTDKNDVLSKEEFFKGHLMMFNKMDANGDGFVNAKEASSSDKCGSGKCGEGKCGGDKKESKKSGKCGAGKCGG